jgi:fructuronate reductase
LGTMTEATHPCPGLALAVAAWMQYVGGVDEKGQSIEVKDPLAAELRLAATSADPVGALLALRAVFSPEQAVALEGPLRAAHARLLALGAHAAVSEVLLQEA